MTYGYQYVDDGTGNPQSGVIRRWPDGAFIPNDNANMDWLQYQSWLAAGNITYPLGYCYQSTNTTQPPVETDPVQEFPDFVIVSPNGSGTGLWIDYKAWWHAGWRPIPYP